MENEIKPTITVLHVPQKLRPFSKLKKQIESLFDPELKMRFCCSAFPMRTHGRAYNSIPRFYLKMGKEILWDYPKDFAVKDIPYGYWAAGNGISELVRDYIDTPVSELLDKEFAGEKWEYSASEEIDYKLTDLFKAADRRIGKKKLTEWSPKLKNYRGYKIICVRLYGWEGLIKTEK